MATNELIVEFDYNFSLFGVVCSLREYQVAYYINNLLDVDFERSNDVQVNFVKGGSLSFSIFTSETESSCLRLIKNRAIEYDNVRKPFFLPEVKEYDYFLQVEGELHDWYEECLEGLLKGMTHIQYVKKLEVENIDLKENLIY
tara:strand:- start:867 stop:1295 length:429 start_codon:yes stop_codon:yes gene_type:complete